MLLLRSATDVLTLVPGGLLDLLNDRQGWGEDACDDAATYYLYTVTTGADSGAGSLRAALESTTAYWIVFDPGLTITIDTLATAPAKKVLDGRGSFPVITNSGLETGLIKWTGDDVIGTDCTFDGGVVSWDVDTETGDLMRSDGNVSRHFFQFCHFRRAGDGAWDARNGLGQYFTLQNSIVSETYQGFNHTADFVSSLRNLFWNVRRRAMQMIDGKGYIAQCAIGGPSGESWNDAAIISAKETLSDGSVYSDENAWQADGVGVGSTDAGGSSMNFNDEFEPFGAVTQTATGTVDSTFVTNSRANWDRVDLTTDNDRYSAMWRACGGGPRNEVRSVYVAGQANGTIQTIDLDALVSGGILAGDVVLVAYKGETPGGAAGITLAGFTRDSNAGPGNIRVAQYSRVCDGSETTAAFSATHTAMEWTGYVLRSPGKAVTTITPSTFQTANGSGDPADITVSPGTTERLCVAFAIYGSDAAVNPRTSSITMRETQGPTTDMYSKLMVWDAKFNPPPASFTAGMDDEGGGNVVSGGYFDIS